MTYSVISPDKLQEGQKEDISVVKANFDAIAADLLDIRTNVIPALNVNEVIKSQAAWTDSGQADFIPASQADSGIYLVEVVATGFPVPPPNGYVLAVAVVGFMAYTGTNWHLNILASNSQAVAPAVTFSIVSNDSASAKLRMASSGGTSNAMTASLRRMNE